MINFIALLLGILFSLGLAISGMINPDKVKGFLDILGNWDYSLAFVMGGAVFVNFIFFPLILKRKPVYAKNCDLPKKAQIDAKLIIGSSLFGIGWGISGICPGPGFVNLARLDLQSLSFILAMIIGMYSYKKIKI